MFKLAIFDLDGTLLNSLADLAAACNHALRECGYPERAKEEYNMLVGRGIYNLFRGALPEAERTQENILRMKSCFIPYYNAHKCDLTEPYEGVREMLRRIQDEGIMIAVASNKYQEGTEQLVRHFFSEREFVKIIGQRDGMPIKPDPEIVREIQAAAKVGDEETVYVGDSDVDMLTGRNAGVRTIGVTWGFRTREELAQCGPWAVCDSAEEVGGLILGEDCGSRN